MIHTTTRRFTTFLRQHRLPLLMALVWGTVFAAFALARHQRLNSSAFDLGIKAQVIWNTWQGDWFASSIEVSNYLGDHVQFIFLLLAPLFGLWNDPQILLIAQAILLAAGALPLYRITKRRLNDELLAGVFTAVYLLYPLLGFVNRFDFHPVVFTIPFFLAAYDLLETDHPWWASFFILLSLSLREEVGLTVFAFGLYAALFLKRPFLGLLWSAAGLLWSLTALFIIIPAYRGGASDTVGRYTWLGESPGQIARSLVTRPALLWEHLTEPYRLALPVKLLLPVGFLALLAPAALLVTLPALAYNLLSDTPSQSSIYFQYLAPTVPFIFIAAIGGAKRLLDWLDHGRARWFLTAWLLLGTLLAWLWDNPFTQVIDEPYFPVYALERFTDEPAFREAAALLPPDAAVATMMAYGPHLALRPDLALFYDRLQLLERPYGFPQSEYLLLNLSDWRWGVNGRFFLNAIETAIGRFGYEALYANQDVVLLQQGAPPGELTGAVLARTVDLLESGGKYSPADPATVAWLGEQWIVDELPATAVPTTAQFEQGIRLLGYEAPTTSNQGRPMCVTLYWAAETAVAADYTVFLHLVAPDGFIQAQRDGGPVFGYHPTSTWQHGQIIADLHCLVLPLGLAPGDYTLRTGLYDAQAGNRLSLLTPPSLDNAFDLAPVAIE
jgi:uncharacterized membrane protein